MRMEPAPPPPVALIYLHSYNNLSLHVSMNLLLYAAPRQIILHRPSCHVQVQLLRLSFQIKSQTAGDSSVMRITCTMVMMRSLKEGRLCHHTSRACNNARLVCELCILSWCARPWIGKKGACGLRSIALVRRPGIGYMKVEKLVTRRLL
jgi:hypothetical protein